MRLAALILTSLLAVSATTDGEKKKQKILEKNHLRRMDISTLSRADFNAFMGTFCLTDLSSEDFLNKYILWENAQFLESVKDFLNPTNNEAGELNDYFRSQGHEFTTNCSIRDEKALRDAHAEKHQFTLFDNWMYDRMTRSEWTELNL